MSMRLDVNNLPMEYTLVLSRRNHKHFGRIVNINNLTFKNNLASANEISFDVYKELNEVKEEFWRDITDFKFVYVVELDEYYEIKVDLNDSMENIKSIVGTSACECELSQSYIYGLEINTEADISREAYEPTVLYSAEKPGASLLHRALSKMTNYSIAYVDETIAHIQRTFSADGKTVYDFLADEVAKEIGCLFVFNSVDRSISVYDLKTSCRDCGYRADFDFTCPECGSKKLRYFGDDTVIYVDTENLSDNITFTTDTDSVKNCFKLEAGDDNMTAAVVNLNPNGSGYIYHFSNDQKKDMSPELVDKIETYDVLADSVKAEYEVITSNIYDCIDKIVYYTSTMMPTIEHEETNAIKEAAKLTVSNLSPVALTKVSSATSVATVNSALKNYIKIFINSGKFKVEINEGTFSFQEENSSSGFNYGYWNGNFKVTNYSDETDTAVSSSIQIVVNDDYEAFLDQKIKKKICTDDEDGSVFDVLSIKEIAAFGDALTLYCLNRLTSFYDAIQGVVDIMIEEDHGSAGSTFYELYKGYKQKLDVCQKEINTRSATISVYENTKKINEGERRRIQELLNFEKYLGAELYSEFCCFRREDKFSNSNYVSDGLANNEIFNRAKEFLEAANKEIYKASQYQHSISANLYNLLAMKEFRPLSNKFKLGNWIRVKVDEDIFRLRLISYQVSFDDITKIDVEFSDVLKVRDGVSDLQSILEQSSSMAGSYDSIMNQVKNDSDTVKIVDGWVQKGLDATKTLITNDIGEQAIVFDKHGFLCRKYDDVTEDYDDCQLKIINNGLYITDDNWNTINTALGKYFYVDPLTNQMKIGYGLQAKQIIGELIAGERLIIRNKDSSFVVDDKGVKIEIGGKPIEDIVGGIGKTVLSVDSEYYMSTSNTEPIGGEWVTSSPEFIVGCYLWTRQIVTFIDGESEIRNVACISTSVGKNIVVILEEYAQSTSPYEQPTEGWDFTSPEWEEGIYIWARTRIIYSDSSEDISNPVCVTGNDGKDGTYYGVNIDSSNGNIFKNDNVSTTLTCSVFKNSEDITTTIPIQNFLWKKINSDGTLDDVWNNNHLTGSKSVVITKEDVDTRATFRIEVDMFEAKVTSQYTITIVNDGENGLSIIWKGESATPPANPQKNWCYRDTDDGIIYIYNGSSWQVMVVDGNDGDEGAPGSDGMSVYITYHDSLTQPEKPTGDGTTGGWHTNATVTTVWMSQKIAESSTSGVWGEPIKIKAVDGLPIIWKGELKDPPTNPEKNWCYRDTDDGIVYIYTGTQWQIMVSDGNDGVPGTPGTSIEWKGTFTAHPSNPQNGWAYYNSTDKKSYVYQGAWYLMSVDGVQGNKGEDGLSIVWKGELKVPPTNPQKNWCYRDTDDGVVYIFNGTSWEAMVVDGSDGLPGAAGNDGLSVFITYNDSITKPATPTGNGTTNGWHSAPNENCIWMSQKVSSSVSTGTWGTPIKIKGNDGLDGQPGEAGMSVFITYHDQKDKPAIPTGTGTTNGWHTNQTSTSVWMSQKVALTAGTGTWGEPVQIKVNNEIEEIVIKNKTKLETVDGQITALVTATTITKENGVTVQLKDDYTSTVTTLNGIVSTVGTHTTTLEGVDTRIAAVEQTSSGIATRVTNTEKKFDNYKTGEELDALIGENGTLTGEISTLKETTTELQQTSSNFTLKINELEQNKESSTLKNKTVVIDVKGLTVGSDKSTFSSTLDETGLYIKAVGVQIAKFDNEGAEIKDLKITGITDIAGLRIQKVTVGSEVRTHIHFTG